MVDVPRSLTDDFLLLETVNQEKGAARAIHMVIPEKGVEYKLGRGHEADVKITDISVSRLHATVKATKRGFILLDNNSKFGTLLHLPNKAVFKFEQKPLLQIGRTKFVASVRDATAITKYSVERVSTGSVKASSVNNEEGVSPQKNSSGSKGNNVINEDERQIEDL
eukprot:TRINITY_DN411_c0_g1_i14.p1 TRINITY_DN411_c0_g1~~TRINITY_DN411_c0_g1_i14.p1  ORF type:complete len:166 (+),score=55.03 TRINITY_DN411_c0_g1_i14:279-776(+)